MKDIKDIKFEALMDISRGIVENRPEDELFQLFWSVCLGKFYFEKMGFFILRDSIWVDKSNKEMQVSEFDYSYLQNLDLSKDIHFLDPETKPRLLDADIFIPVFHKNHLNAMILLKNGKDDFDYEVFLFLRKLAGMLLVVSENKQLTNKEIQRNVMNKELELASKVQHLLFPKKLPNSELVQMHVSYIPHKLVGGDYYDYIRVKKGEFIVCVADVSGKGMGAALIMSNFQAALRSLVRMGLTLEKIAEELNYQIVSNSEGSHFVTAFFARINTKTQTITTLNAGHNPPFFIDSEGRLTVLNKGCTILGALDKLPSIGVQDFHYERNSLLMMFTDGVTETINRKGELYSEERIMNFVSERYEEPLEDLHLDIMSELYSYKQEVPFPDDFTLVSLKLK